MKTLCYYIEFNDEINYRAFTSALFTMMTLTECTVQVTDVEKEFVELTITCKDDVENIAVIQTMLSPYL